MTNGDRIRQMSNEELAGYLNYNMKILACDVCVHGEKDECDYECIAGIKAYLESEEE
jgi:hypothetical protein